MEKKITRIGNAGEVCQLPKVTGSCEIEVLRYYYNGAENRCQLFFYGGCKGNGNNFNGKDSCERACLKAKSIQPTVKPGPKVSPTPGTGAASSCQLPMDVGFCDIDVLRYYYNSTENKCRIFTYHGCFGNANNFMTKLECDKKCLMPEKNDFSDYNVDSELSFAVEDD
ncbi:BPTI/Kunitz domain-containing protein-like [Mantella aurantiaca]